MPSPSRLLRTAAVVTVAALSLTACAATGSDEEVTFAIAGANLSDGHMDPQVSQLDVSAMVQRVVLDSLVYQEADASFSPWLAEAWTVSEDGTSYTFELRDDVTFSDGAPFNADAVKLNFDRIMDPATESAQARSMLGGELFETVEVIDEFTVAVNFTQPFAPFLQAASTPQLGFWSPNVLASPLTAMRAGGPDVNIGTGPFILSEYTPNESIVYTRNPDYSWGPAGATQAGFETLRVELLPEQAVRVGVVNSGEADLATNLPPSTVSELSSELTVNAVEYAGMPYSLLLNEGNGVFADQAVRQAFSRAIDIDDAVDAIYFGQFHRAWSILGEKTPGYDPSLVGTWPYDPAVANSLLDSAGWTERDADGIRMNDGQRLSARWIAWTPVSDDNAALANTIQDNLADIGFEIVRDVLEPTAYNLQYGPRTFDIADWGFSGVDPDLLRSHLATGGFQNASQVSDPTVDALLNEGLSVQDPVARDEVYAQIQEWNAQHVAIVPLYSPALITAVNDRVRGLEFDLYGRPLFYNVTLE